MESDFEEIAHCGGQVIFRVMTDEDGRRTYRVAYHHCSMVACAFYGIYALPQGIPVGIADVGGVGQPADKPSFNGCYLVLISSDSEGKFGHQCPTCSGYWRGGGFASICPYCGTHGAGQDFLTIAQRSYIDHYCETLEIALHPSADSEHVIDMDEVAKAAGKDAEKPAFYYAEERQQNRFTCTACGQFNDILGKFGFCSTCGTRNDLDELEQYMVPALRQRINTGGPYEACGRDAVVAFDCMAAQYVKQLVRLIPMTPKRRNLLEVTGYHNVKVISDRLKLFFDINLFEGLKDDDISYTIRMFYRRHVYEHNGGEADEKYIAESGDTSTRLKEALRETQPSTHRLVGLIVKMARNLHRGFHEIFPPNPGPIGWYKNRNSAG